MVAMFARFITALLFLGFAGTAEAGPRLDAIAARGHLNCGVATDSAGFSLADANGDYAGFEVEICRAIASAIFGEPRAVLLPATTLQSFLQSPEIDVILRALTWTFRRETNGSVRFGPTYFYDGQTFLVRKADGINTHADLAGQTICASVDIYADFLTPLRQHFNSHGWVFEAHITTTRAEAEALFFAGQCTAITADATELASALIAQADEPDAYEILSEQYTKEPIAPLLHRDDDEFFNIVRWSVFALINAEEAGLTSENIDALRSSDDPAIQAFLTAPPPGAGFDPAWSYAIVKHVGNFGELYERHVGGASAAKLERGLNRLWTDGGLLYAPPFR